MPPSPLCARALACRFARGVLAFLAFALLFCAAARAQVIDRIDVVQSGAEAEIRIRFVTQLQYQRHSPQREGSLLRVFIRFTGQDSVRDELIQETKPGPRSSLIEPFTVTFPEQGALLVKFTRSTSFRVRQGGDGRSIIVTVPASKRAAEPTPAPAIPAKPPEPAAPAPAPQPPAAPAQSAAPAVPALAAPAPTTSAEVESLALRLIAEARKALADKSAVVAVDRLNQLLNLPPNAASEAAQALIGEAREMNEEPAKARAEYELYLKLYPQGSETAKVRERLAQLGTTGAPGTRPAADGRPAREAPAPRWVVSGSFFQYWYGGQSQVEILTPTPGLTFSRETLTSIDQRALVSTLDFNARQRGETTDTRIVVRDTHTANFLRTLPNRNRLNAAYFERSDSAAGYLVRAGRQPGNAGGVLGRFDGLWVGYNLAPRWRLNGVLGTPVEFGSPYKKSFYGINLDLVPQLNRWGGNIYYLHQGIDGVVDRRAVGAEARFFDERSTYFGMLDYDLSFRRINIAMLQGNWQSEGRTNYFFLLDHRRSPPYSITNGLIGQGLTSVRTFLDSSPEQTLRDQALQLTSRSNLAMVGFTHPFTEHWQLGADVRVSNVSGTGAVGDMPLSNGTGNIVVYTVQAIGNALWLGNDFGVVNASMINSPTYSGQSIALNYVNMVSDRTRLDGSLRFYSQKDGNGIRLTRVAPTFKTVYRIGERWFLEGELAMEITSTQGPTQSEKSRRHYAYFGYRWDFY